MSVASLAARIVMRLSPADRRDWAHAMACEIAAVEGAGTRRFALGCIAAAAMLRIDWIGRRGMKMVERPRAATVACGVVASVLGLVHLVAAGASPFMPVTNAVALVLALTLLAFTWRTTIPAGVVVVATGAVLLATAFLGSSAEGATRWVRIAGIAVQPSLILLPLAIVLHVTGRNRATTAGLALAALALAVQPDRAMAGALLVALLAGGRRSGAIAPAAAAIGLAVAMIRPDAVPAVPSVDGVLYAALHMNVVAAVAVFAGTAILLAPLAIARAPATAAFGACWLGVVAAAALGDYPTPLVGFGGSAILGYLLAAARLPAGRASRARTIDTATAAGEETRLFRLA
ncbi:hypothetical protein ASG29_12715 [Sphingomonas sp. Leaf412]|uniref:hypothetical protein n=1 Tax=Sphingomonas sp. Leaf412 TaxID=1736370 RepID=UPI0006FDC3CE|nr:hypothetical protein [Sphingomonas sp. Leaf412]KQT32609.1 hypothetical protein ASG29_12715 [Sphingomonas sp. Leaf412]